MGRTIVDTYTSELLGGKFLPKIGPLPEEYSLDGDSVNTYRMNSHGYRSDEFASGVELLFAGCSVTYGSGVPEKSIWGNYVADTLGVSRFAVAAQGHSVESIVSQLFSYFYEFGNPKILLCLFPDPYRIKYPIDNKVVGIDLDSGQIIKRTKNADGQSFSILQTKYNYYYNRDINHVKRPYDASVVVSEDMAIYQNIRSIRMLEQYCKATGITLVWSSWQDHVYDEISAADNDQIVFDNYFSMSKYVAGKYRKETKDATVSIFSNVETYDYCKDNHLKIECSCSPSCHRELLEKHGSQNFHNGTDLADGLRHSHPGIHLHAHYAEAFLDNL